ncbi:MAG: diguanylate cyclase [Acidimicrobiales bacterium]|nr:diguanylate cyclase [Acidimicrobiales bacterium]
MDRLTVSAVLAGVLGLTAGVAALLGAPLVLALVAGAMAAGLAGVVVVDAGRLGVWRDRATHAEGEVDRLKRALHDAEEAREDAEARLEWRTTFTARRRSTEANRLTDETTGLLAEGWFVVALESRLATARRNLRPVAVVMLEVVVGLRGGAPEPADPRRVTAAVTATIREADEAFRLRDGVFALLLEDTTDSGATWTAERVRLALAEIEPDAVLWAGVACYPAHGLSTEEVLDRVDQALDNAREWRQHRIEVASAEG